MNEEIKRILEKDERILWTGKPQKNALFDEDTKQRSILRIVLSTAIPLLLIGIYVNSCVKNGLSVRIGLVAALAVIGLCAMMGIYTTWRTLGKIEYVITDQRVYIFHAYDKYFALPLELIDETRVVTGANGLDSLCIGSPACKLANHKLRAAGVEGCRIENADSSFTYYPVFYNLADANNVKKFIDGIINR